MRTGTLGALGAMLAVTPAVAQEHTSVAPEAMQAVAPGLADYTDDVLFGDVWRRPALSPRDRSLVTLSVLIATGKTGQLRGHLGRGLDNGVTPAEISGLVTHLAFYAGWPSAVSALDVIEQVFDARNIDTAALTQIEQAPRLGSDSMRAATVMAQVGPIAPKLAGLTNAIVFGDLWRRADLTPRDRSLVTIAALAGGGDSGQLAFHLKLGLENGLTQGDIAEAITHLAFYAGWPKAMAAIAVARTALDERRTAMTDPKLQIVPAGLSPSAGAADYFTGAVSVASAFKGTGGARLGGATVTFQPGAHTNWHTHPLGQLLIVTAGSGWVQVDGERARSINTGDTVWIAPGVKHWHGASQRTGVTHVAVSEAVDGSSVTWLEPLADADYAAIK